MASVAVSRQISFLANRQYCKNSISYLPQPLAKVANLTIKRGMFDLDPSDSRPTSVLAARFRSAFQASPYKSLRRLSDDCNCAHSQAQKIWSGGFGDSSHGPGVISLWRLCTALGIGLNDLLPPPPSTVDRPGVGAFFSRYQGNETPIGNFADIIDFCDTYRKPIRGKTRLQKVGPRSYLAEKAQTTDAVVLQLEYESWPLDRRRRIFEWHRRAWSAGATSEPDGTFMALYPSSPRVMRIPLLRAACRVVDNSEPLLLIYCEPLPLRQELGSIGQE